MDADSLAIAVVVALVLVLVVHFLAARRRERGNDPHLAREVYLLYDPADPRPDVARVAQALGAEVATAAQVATYAAVGGSCHGAGLTAEGSPVELTPAGRGALAVTAHTPGDGPIGVWLYGPKPRRGTAGVEGFGCREWFQPPGAAPHVF